jgi:antitoxin component YwqK of YwqJK toxin-antitoxin module
MIVLGLRLGQGGRRSPEPLEQVGRDRLVLREGRWMKTDETNAFTGWMVDFYPDGSLQSRSAVSNGVLSGPSEGWWTNGVKAILEQFQDGRSHGVRTKWDAAGHRISETEIRTGQIHGWHREWHTNGQRALEVSMSEGRPHGLSRKWNPEGVLIGQWSLSNGVVKQALTNAVELQGLAQQGVRP